MAKAFYRKPGRFNLFLLPDGAVAVRARDKASRGIKLARHIHAHEIAGIKRIFLPMTDGRLCPVELYDYAAGWRPAAPRTPDGRIPPERLRRVAKLYRERIRKTRRGEPLTAATLGADLVLGRA